MRTKAQEWEAKFFRSDNQFLRYSQPKEELYEHGRDNLHPSEPGSQVLSQSLTKETSLLRKELGLPTHKKALYTRTRNYTRPDGGYHYEGERKRGKPILNTYQPEPTYAPKKEKYFEVQARIKTRRLMREGKQENIEDNNNTDENPPDDTLNDIRYDPKLYEDQNDMEYNPVTYEEHGEEMIDVELENPEPTEEDNQTQWHVGDEDPLKLQVTIDGPGRKRRSKTLATIDGKEGGINTRGQPEIIEIQSDEHSEVESKQPKNKQKKTKSKKNRKEKEESKPISPKPRILTPSENENYDTNTLGTTIRELIKANEDERKYYRSKLAESEERRWQEYEKRHEEKRWFESERRNSYMRDMNLDRTYMENRWYRMPMGYGHRSEYDERRDYEEYLDRKYSSSYYRRDEHHRSTRSRSPRNKRHSRDRRSSSKSQHSRSRSYSRDRSSSRY